MWQIVINGPGYFDTSYDLPEGTTTLGRADENDIVLSGDLVSRRHASLRVRGSELRFEDLGSRNGSKVNGVPVQKGMSLKPGDTVALGENTLGVREVTAAARDATEPPSSHDEGSVRSSIILSKSVSESLVLRALDNVFPMGNEDTPSPHVPVPREKERDHAREVAYESLLLISRVAELLATSNALQPFLDTTMDLLMRSSGASTGVLLVRDTEARLSPAVVRHRGKLTQGEVPVSRAIVNEALAQGKALAVADVRGDPRFSRRDSVVLYAAGQVLCIPLGNRAPFAGALYLNRSQQPEEELAAVLGVYTAVAHLVATGVEKFSPAESPERRVREAWSRALAHAPDGRADGADPTALERDTATVLFADLSGFTSASKQLPPPAVGELLQQFYECFSRVVWSFDGAVVGFVGDSGLAVFDGPRDGPARAVRAALTLKQEWQRACEGRPGQDHCQVKSGLHTGPTLTGVVATARRAEFVAVGEPVNTAAWLVGLAGPGQVLMTGKTLSAVGARFKVSTVGDRSLSGRTKLTVYEVEGEDPHVHTNPGAA